MGLKLKHLADPFTSAINRVIDKGPSKFGGTLNDLTGSTDMLKKEYANNVALWNMQNEYNTPAAQIARMKAAGIDVNPLTYAVGNGNMSTTASNISAPSVGASGINPIASLVSVLSTISDLRLRDAQAGYISEQTRALRAENVENEDFGTSRGTPFVVKLGKHVVHIANQVNDAFTLLSNSLRFL